MKHLLLFCLLLPAFLLFSQNKKTYFLNENLTHSGILSKDSLSLLKSDLELSAHTKINSTDLIVIDFYPGKDDCNSTGMATRYDIKKYQKDYLKQLHSLASISQFNIYAKKEGLKRYGGLENWNPDLNSRVKNTFFPLDYPCGSFVVIRSDGRYMSGFGEYPNELVYDYVKQLSGKKTYFLNENLARISETSFWEDENRCNVLRLRYYLDTADMYVKVSRFHDGIISKDSLSLLKRDLELSAATSIDSTNLIVIDFYPGKDECNSSGSASRFDRRMYHKQYLKKLHSLAPVCQFSIYGKEEGLERHGGFKVWKPDLNSRVKNNFFPLDYPCGSVVVIRPDGYFMSFFGEYSKELVWNFVKQLRRPKP